MAVHRITDAAEAALHRVCPDGKMGEFISQLIVDYERGLTFKGAGIGGSVDGAPTYERQPDTWLGPPHLRGEGRKP